MIIEVRIGKNKYKLKVGLLISGNLGLDILASLENCIQIEFVMTDSKSIEIKKLCDNKRIKVFTFDLINDITEGIIKELGDIHYIVHLAAEIDERDKPDNMLKNLNMTVPLLNYLFENLDHIIYLSTLEVYANTNIPIIADVL